MLDLVSKNRNSHSKTYHVFSLPSPPKADCCVPPTLCKWLLSHSRGSARKNGVEKSGGGLEFVVSFRFREATAAPCILRLQEQNYGSAQQRHFDSPEKR